MASNLILIKMRRYIYTFGLCFFIYNCSNKDRKYTKDSNDNKIITTDTAIVNGVLMELIDSSGVGKLKIHSNKFKIAGNIKIEAPLYFVKVNNRALNFSYRDVGVSHTIVILGDIIGKEERTQKNIEKGRICGRSLQGILFKKDSIIYEDFQKDLFSSSVDCNDGLDEKMYWSFAHRTYKK